MNENNNIISGVDFGIPDEGVWGVWDGDGDAWIGTKDGPNRYGSKMLAGMAATIANQQMKATYRFTPKRMPDSNFVHKDEVDWVAPAQ